MAWADWVKWAARFHIDEDECKEMTRFFHEIGLVQHYDVAGLRDLVILEASWLIERMSDLIHAYGYHVSSKDEELKVKRPQWFAELTNGTITPGVVDFVWSDLNESEREACLGILELFHLIIPLRSKTAIAGIFIFI